MAYFRPSLGMMGIPHHGAVVVYCAACGQRGHASAQCTNNRGSNAGPAIGIQIGACNHCGKFGHREQNCTYAPSALGGAAVIRLNCNARHQGCMQNHSQHFCDYCNNPDAYHISGQCPQRAADAARAAAARAPSPVRVAAARPTPSLASARGGPAAALAAASVTVLPRTCPVLSLRACSAYSKNHSNHAIPTVIWN